MRTAEAKPSFELVDSNKSIVRIRPADPDAPVVGCAFYLMRGGAWRKVAEVGSSCVLVNASLAMPWDPVLVLPVVRQDAWVRQGDAVVLWSAPKTMWVAATLPAVLSEADFAAWPQRGTAV